MALKNVKRKISRLLVLAVFLAPLYALAQDAMSPDDWLVQASQQLQSGNIEDARISALKVLDIGQKRSNPAWIGDALAILCRVSVAEGNSDALRKYVAELQALIDATGDQRWSGVVAEMNAALGGM